jgi:putative ABC transport system permease protein
MKYFRLLRVSLFRKKIRTFLTIGSFAIAMFLFGTLAIIRLAFNQGVEIAGTDRLIVMNRVTFIEPLPLAYRNRMVTIQGIKEVTFATWFGGIYQDKKNFFPQFAVDVDSWRQMYPEFIVSDSAWKAFVEDREGAIVGEGTAKRFGWKVGDRIPIKGDIFRGDWQFNIRGIYKGSRPADDTTQFWFDWKRLNEAQRTSGYWRDSPGWYVVKLAHQDEAATVLKKIDETFANSSAETKSDTEASFAASFVKQTGNIELILMAVGSVVFFTLLLVTGNTMAIAVRERTPELAIFKALGYSNRFVLFYVIAESVSIALLGGLIGIGLAKVSTLWGSPVPGILPLYILPMKQVLLGILFAIGIGAVAGFIPAITASRLRVVEALRKI